MASALATLVRRGGPQALPAARALLRPPFLNQQNVLRAAKAGAEIVPDLQLVLSSSAKEDIYVYGSALEALATLKMDVTQEAMRALDDTQIFFEPPTPSELPAKEPATKMRLQR